MDHKIYKKPTVIISICLSLFACSGGDSSNEGGGKVLATVAGKEITSAQFDAYLKHKRLPADDEKKYKNILEQYVERESLAAAIEKSEILDKALVEAELNEFRKEMLISRYFESFLKEKITDLEVQNYYNSNMESYQERKVRVSHVLVRTNKNMGETERQAKLTTAQAAYSKITAGEAFETVVGGYSEDHISAKKGGDLGWLKEGSIDPRFSEKVFSMKPGDISTPFETAFGFHVVKLVEGPMVVTKSFDAVKGDIRYQLRNKAKDAELARLVKLVE